MLPSELARQYQILAGIDAITSVVWLIAGFFGIGGYLQFRQRSDALWALAFFVLSLVRAADVSAALQVIGEIPAISAGAASVLEVGLFTRLRVAPVEMLAAFLIIYLFRRRHELLRRAPVD